MCCRFTTCFYLPTLVFSLLSRTPLMPLTFQYRQRLGSLSALTLSLMMTRHSTRSGSSKQTCQKSLPTALRREQPTFHFQQDCFCCFSENLGKHRHRSRKTSIAFTVPVTLSLVFFLVFIHVLLTPPLFYLSPIFISTKSLVTLLLALNPTGGESIKLNWLSL